MTPLDVVCGFLAVVIVTAMLVVVGVSLAFKPGCHRELRVGIVAKHGLVEGQKVHGTHRWVTVCE